jgi:AcrR family transcriptional regulator
MRAAPATGRAPRRPRQERETLVLDTAARLFYARGVHEVGMDELVRATGLGKATVYRLYPTKDALVAAYLRRLAATIGAAIGEEIMAHEDDPGGALLAILDAIEADLRRPGFRGCPFNNASIEFDDPDHPARVQARAYREQLRGTLSRLAVQLARGNGGTGAGSGDGEPLGSQLAVLIDGAYTSAAHLGPDGPAAAGLSLARHLVQQARTRP